MNIERLCSVTSLSYCDDDCPCGGASRLLWAMPGDDIPDWLPNWVNGISPDELWGWMIKQSDPRVVAAVYEVEG